MDSNRDDTYPPQGGATPAPKRRRQSAKEGCGRALLNERGDNDFDRHLEGGVDVAASEGADREIVVHQVVQTHVELGDVLFGRTFSFGPGADTRVVVELGDLLELNILDSYPRAHLETEHAILYVLPPGGVSVDPQVRLLTIRPSHHGPLLLRLTEVGGYGNGLDYTHEAIVAVPALAIERPRGSHVVRGQGGGVEEELVRTSCEVVIHHDVGVLGPPPELDRRLVRLATARWCSRGRPRRRRIRSIGVWERMVPNGLR